MKCLHSNFLHSHYNRFIALGNTVTYTALQWIHCSLIHFMVAVAVNILLILGLICLTMNNFYGLKPLLSCDSHTSASSLRSLCCLISLTVS